MTIRCFLIATALTSLAACTDDEDKTPTASATISPLVGAASGTAMFTQTDTGVALSITLDGGCTAGKSYPVHIHQGASCADATAQGGHWDMTRGEGIPNIACSGTSGTSQVTRAADPATTAWSIGGDAATDVVGHVIVVHDADTPTMRIACGVIAP